MSDTPAHDRALPASPLSEERIDELKRLAEAAMPGEWLDFFDEPHGTGFGVVYRVGLQDEEEHIAEMGYATHEAACSFYRSTMAANARFIAAANPATVLALLCELSRLREDAARLDWIADRTVTVTPIMEMCAEPEDDAWCVEPYDSIEGRGPTLRDAIDAARRSPGADQ